MDNLIIAGMATGVSAGLYGVNCGLRASGRKLRDSSQNTEWKRPLLLAGQVFTAASRVMTLTAFVPVVAAAALNPAGPILAPPF